jgi:hypothetical protein
LRKVKNTFLLALIVVVLLATTPLITFAAKKAVEINHSGDDSVGRTLVYRIKEEIRRSSNLRLSDNFTPRLILFMVTLDRFSESKGTSSVISTAFTVKYQENTPPMYVTSIVSYCGSGVVSHHAETIVADIDKYADMFLK